MPLLVNSQSLNLLLSCKRSIQIQTRARLFGSTSLSSSDSLRPLFDPKSSFRLTQPPNPHWKPKGGLSVPEDTKDGGELQQKWKDDSKLGHKTWNLEGLPSREIYPLLTSAIIPRPIAFVSSLSADGVPNLAPFSYFSLVAHNPPLISISFSISPRKSKDTRENILATKEFTVNIISEPFAEAANYTSIEAPADVSEWDLSGLRMEESIDVKPARVQESAISLECELYFHQNIPPNSQDITHTLVLGLVKRVHVRRSILSKSGDTVDPAKLRPISRLGGITYSRLGEGFDLPRPSWRHSKG